MCTPPPKSYHFLASPKRKMALFNHSAWAGDKRTGVVVGATDAFLEGVILELSRALLGHLSGEGRHCEAFASRGLERSPPCQHQLRHLPLGIRGDHLAVMRPIPAGCLRFERSDSSAARPGVCRWKPQGALRRQMRAFVKGTRGHKGDRV